MRPEQISDLYITYLGQIQKGGIELSPLPLCVDILKGKYGEDKLDLEVTDRFWNGTIHLEYEDFKSEEFFKTKLLPLFEGDFDAIKEKIRMDSHIILNYINVENLKVIIKYGDVTIETESGRTHLIRGLYARFNINVKGGVDRFKIIRDTYTLAEMGSHYRHSHASSSCNSMNGLSRWDTTCLGSGPLSIMNMTVDEFNPFDEIKFITYLDHLESYMGWESRTGVPYRYISSIRDTRLSKMKLKPNITSPKDIKNGYIYNRDNVLFRLFQNIIRSGNHLNYLSVVTSIHNGVARYKIVFDENKLVDLFNEELLKISTNNFYFYHTDFQVDRYMINQTDAVYYKINEEGTSPSSYAQFNGRNLGFKFKGENVKLTVLGKDIQENTQADRVCNPNIVYLFINKLEEELNKNKTYAEFDRESKI